jgi:hypothetical protein
MYAAIALFILAWSGSYPRHARDITVDLQREIHGLTTLCSATGERVPVKCCRFIPDSAASLRRAENPPTHNEVNAALGLHIDATGAYAGSAIAVRQISGYRINYVQAAR